MKHLRNIIAAFVLTASIPATAQFQKKQITLDDVWLKGTFRPNFIGGLASMNDGLHYMAMGKKNEVDALLKYEYKTGKEVGVLFTANELIPEGQTKPVDMDNFEFSPNEQKVLISTETENIYRYSTKEVCYIFDLKTKKMTALSKGGKQRLATFSPDGKKVAFVRDNNLFVTDLDSKVETQITTDGEWNKIINGGTDWVYEEEFALPKGLQWSPDSKRVAFYKFDESRVKEFGMTMYNTGLYPEPYSYKYPKAGEENSIVSIRIYDVVSKQTTLVDVGSEKDQYIPRIKWTNDPKTLTVTRLNRLQNKLELLYVDAASGKSRVVLTEKRDTYIEVNDDLTYLADGSFIWSSDEDGNQHLYHYSADGERMTQITKGNWDVIAFYGIDEKKKILYYQSNEEHVTKRAVYSVSLDGKTKKKISTREGNNVPTFSKGFQYFTNQYSAANTPWYFSVNSADGKEIKKLEDNTALSQKVAEYGFSKKEFFTFENREKMTLHGWMIKPANFDASKKYPVLMVVYGGPGRNTVVDQWETSDFYWQQLMAQKGYLVVSVDNRGTEYRGAAFKKSTYGKMGELESADQIDAAKWLGTQSYVDKDRIGIQGWSYGGYMASLCLAVGADVFKLGIAVAPVSNWRYYDSIYTERYMGMPQSNGKGYDAFSPTNNMDKLKGKLLLVHGTADDNVHFQNSIELVNALVKNNKQFDFYMYPDKNHSIRGGNARLHLFTKITGFIESNL